MQPFLAQIMIVSFPFAPKGWALCNGQLLPINQNQALFSLFGTSYGGDGRVTFGLPNLQGRIPNGMGGGYQLGQIGGVTTVTLTTSQMPAHTHTWNASQAAATSGSPAGTVLAAANAYTPAPVDTPMSQAAVSSVGGNQSHNNMMPFLVLNYCIALQGIFPTQN